MTKKLAVVRSYNQLISNIGQLIELGRKRAVGQFFKILENGRHCLPNQIFSRNCRPCLQNPRQRLGYLTFC